MPKAMDELRKLTSAELKKRLQDFRKELYQLRFEKMTGKLEDYSRVHRVRRNIARILTVMKEEKST